MSLCRIDLFALSKYVVFFSLLIQDYALILLKNDSYFPTKPITLQKKDNHFKMQIMLINYIDDIVLVVPW